MLKIEFRFFLLMWLYFTRGRHPLSTDCMNVTHSRFVAYRDIGKLNYGLNKERAEKKSFIITSEDPDQHITMIQY